MTCDDQPSFRPAEVRSALARLLDLLADRVADRLTRERSKGRTVGRVRDAEYDIDNGPVREGDR